MIPIQDDLDLGKVSKLLGALLEQGNTATIDAALTALGQIGYDTTLLRAKIYNGTSVGILLERGDIDTDTSFTSPSNTKVPSTQAVVTYIANLIASGTRIRGSVTLTTASTYPVATAAAYTNGTQTGNGSGAGPIIKAGDAWYVGNTSSFQMGPTSGNTVKKGDLVVALSDSAGNVDASWLILQSNVDEATTSLAGLVILTTLALLQAGTGDTVVTAGTLTSFLDNPESGDVTSKYVRSTEITQTLNFGSNTVTHNKGTQRIKSVTFLNASTFARTDMGWTASTVNTITVTRTGLSQSFIIIIEY